MNWELNSSQITTKALLSILKQRYEHIQFIDYNYLDTSLSATYNHNLCATMTHEHINLFHICKKPTGDDCRVYVVKLKFSWSPNSPIVTLQFVFYDYNVVAGLKESSVKGLPTPSKSDLPFSYTQVISSEYSGLFSDPGFVDGYCAAFSDFLESVNKHEFVGCCKGGWHYALLR